ncbi:MAG: DUF3368 domain-containing protein [Xanthomonadales bacterium]|nr:DUF3368 domain-containing protein [Xanthomonadales bacterium]
MTTPLLISDSNILIDFDCCGLLSKVFKLPYVFAVPDVLYIEELSEQHAGLPALGLRVLQFGPDVTLDIAQLRRRYPGSGFMDVMALALARSLGAELLTGDKRLREIARAERHDVKGSVWLLEEMVSHRLLTEDAAHGALEAMRESGRRLPWAKARKVIEQHR